MAKIVEWNPKDLPEEKIATCKCDDHEGKRRGLKCRLTMHYADDNEHEYISGTEEYYCEECYEGLY